MAQRRRSSPRRPSEAIAPALIEIPTEVKCAGCGVATVIRRNATGGDTAFSLEARAHGYQGGDVRLCETCSENEPRIRVVISEARRSGAWRQSWR